MCIRDRSNIVNSSEPEILLNRLKNDLGNYYKSKTWEEISKSKNYKNEFEIYVKENDYYLHGIIDKIIFIENKVLIYDYKTCLLYTSPSPRDRTRSRMPSSA